MIYLDDDAKPSDPALSFNKDYIITAMPMASLPMLLDILRNEKNLQIRYFDPQSPGISPSVFLEPAAHAAQFITSPFRVNPEMSDLLAS